MSTNRVMKIVKCEHEDATKIGKETIMSRIRRASSESCGLAILGDPTVMVVAGRVVKRPNSNLNRSGDSKSPHNCSQIFYTTHYIERSPNAHQKNALNSTNVIQEIKKYVVHLSGSWATGIIMQKNHGLRGPLVDNRWLSFGGQNKNFIIVTGVFSNDKWLALLVPRARSKPLAQRIAVVAA